MDIDPFLWTEEAKAIYAALKSKWNAEDLESYGQIISRYCNELALYRRIEKELAQTESLLQDWTNNKLKTNPKKSELTRARNESALLLIRYEKLLNLIPKHKGGDDLPNIEMPE
jgi:hypothetical protein